MRFSAISGCLTSPASDMHRLSRRGKRGFRNRLRGDRNKKHSAASHFSERGFGIVWPSSPFTGARGARSHISAPPDPGGNWWSLGCCREDIWGLAKKNFEAPCDLTTVWRTLQVRPRHVYPGERPAARNKAMHRLYPVA